MDWITDAIAIGNYLEARDRTLLAAHNIQSILCLDGSLEGVGEDDLGVEVIEVFSLLDGPGNNPEIFRHAVRCVGELAGSCPKLLVHCHAGRSRSVVVVAAHLMTSEGWSANKALTHVTERRDSMLTPGIETILRKLR